MKDFNSYFTERAIITQICKIRVKLAKARNKKYLLHVLTDSKKYNYHINDRIIYDNDFSKYQNDLNEKLCTILPPRKNWVKLGKESRLRSNSTELLSSNDKNFYSLLKTIKLYKKKYPDTQWLKELDKFVKDIQESINNEGYSIEPPIVFPKLKEETILKNEINKCRPISMFSLKDRIILSITNKFLTTLFDTYFKDSSYAFRSKKNKLNEAIISHHDCIKEIIELQKFHNYNPLYVVECDMEKFFDSANHRIVRELTHDLLKKVEDDNPNLEINNAVHIFCEYLDCYTFNHSVPLSTDKEYWASYKIPNGKFEWVEEGLKEHNYYENINYESIGVPQGGALSGLIANIILNEADRQMLTSKVFYIRFCDDMLIIHNDLEECLKAKEIYLNSLKKLYLVPHPFVKDLEAKTNKSSFKPFWKYKSKGPYKWDSINNNGFPWIGFVGYEIHHKGYIRVRKKSLQKEFKKQFTIIEEIEKAIQKGIRKSPGTVTESAINRLIGMSVGRIGLRNYDEVSSDMCWKNGFKELTLNKFSTPQIKQLDRNRSRLYYKLLEKVNSEKEENDENDFNTNAREIVYYNKPFSYYYQILERKRNNE